MINTQHTGIVISAKEADAWHDKIRKIMAEQKITFEKAVDLYINNQPREHWTTELARRSGDD